MANWRRSRSRRDVRRDSRTRCLGSGLRPINPLSLEDLIRSSSRALVVGVGGGGDVVGALATARFLEFCGLGFVLGGLSWERLEVDPLPGPRSTQQVINVRPLHEYAWLARAESRTTTGAI